MRIRGTENAYAVTRSLLTLIPPHQVPPMKIKLLGVLCLLAISACNESTRPAASPAPAKDRDNTAVNERDRRDDVKTPINQNENQPDINITADIRKRVVDTKMSTNAQNVKIITQDGRVTLRGPVKSNDEKARIEEIAAEVAGSGNVDSEIEVEISP